MSKTAKVIVVANQKGGVGKTTTTINLANAAKSTGYKSVILDFDPQNSATKWRNRADTDSKTSLMLPDVINCANDDFPEAAISEAKENYDFVFIDTAGYVGNPNETAFNQISEIILTADLVITPMTSGVSEYESTLETLNFIEAISEQHNHPVEIRILVNSYSKNRTGTLMSALLSKANPDFRWKAFEEYIANSVDYKIAIDNGQTALVPKVLKTGESLLRIFSEILDIFKNQEK